MMVSKALVVGTYQRKLEELASLSGIDLVAIVPSSWRDSRGAVRLERVHVRGYRLVEAPLVFNGSFHAHFYPTLGREMAAFRPDVLHVDEEPYNLATWHALRLGARTGAQGLFFTWQNLRKTYPMPFALFERANYRRSACALAGNHDAAEVLRWKGYRGSVHVIPQFGVDPAFFSPAATGETGATTADANGGPALPTVSQGEFVVGYAGGLLPEKGIDVLIKACAGLQDLRWKLLVLGEGSERSRLATLAGELGVADRVHFLGRWNSTAMPAFYRRLSALVLPSLSRPNWVEQFGRVLTEAMACEVPVVGSDSGEIPHVIGDAGLVFPEGDAPALQGTLALLAGNREHALDLGRRGRQRVLSFYTQAHIAEATHGVYLEMTRGGQGGAAASVPAERSS